MSPSGHLVWWLITATCLLWLGTVTLVVAWKGTRDIFAMLRRLRKAGKKEDEP
ncbi:MAG: hypothetical protein KA072_00360 [Thermoanaerobaculaceae bacterium]|nr:hypothetical protein [Thermoanaerobaculaceae bacterium]MDI9621296.1 hypothetical protein [Acidobacteriota bacterium]NLH09808.1 hypothetical protein [Holophagae bacterium]HPW54172.1 hypothetical protein [Thermoanaerobaculaceae bacterium]